MTNFRNLLHTALQNLTPEKRLMGLDLGTKTIGVATCDRTRQIATPQETVRRTKFTPDVNRLLEIAVRDDVGLIVLGLPINMDGTEGSRAQATRAFARNMLRLTPIPVIFWDERLSTVAVERVLLEGDASRAKRAEVIDKLAAAYILQSALDAM